MFLARFFSSEGMDLLPDGYLFTLPHFLYMAVSALVIVYFVFIIKTDNPRKNQWIITISCILLLFFKYAGEVIFVYEYYAFAEPVSSFSHPFLDWRTLISFQMCGINNILLPIAIWFKIRPMKDFLYLTSICGGLVVILYPSTVLFGDPFTLTFPMIRSLVVHLILVVLPLFLIRIGEFRLELKHWRWTIYGTLITMAWSMYGNLVVNPGANYMFLMSNPLYGGPIPLLNQIPSGLHLILIWGLAYGSLAVCYLLIIPWQRRLDLKKV
jgi:uncharacterized membrane protein YwaF